MLGVGAWLVIGTHASPGVMVAATILLGRALQPVEQLIGGWRALVDARGAWRRLSERDERSCGATSRRAAGAGGPTRGRARRVRHRRRRGRALIKGVSFALEAGESLGIVGPSASGKTTLVRLLLGIWKPQAGVGAARRRRHRALGPRRARRARRLPAAGRRAVRRHGRREHRAARRGRFGEGGRGARAARACARDDPAPAGRLRHRRSARRARCCRAASGSASRSRARCTASRGSSCSTSRTPTSTPKARPRSLAALRGAQGARRHRDHGRPSPVDDRRSSTSSRC